MLSAKELIFFWFWRKFKGYRYISCGAARCSVNLVVFECGAVQHADKVCGHSAACGCIFCYLHHLYSQLLGLLWFWREEQNLEFLKTFFGGYLFVFVEYLRNRSHKINTKNIKNYSSILAIVNHQNWLDDSPHLTCQINKSMQKDLRQLLESLFA